MTDQQITKAIAEIDGWTSDENSWHHPNGRRYSQRRSGGKEIPVEIILPSYLTSYDAIIPVIQKQDIGVRCDIGIEVCWEFDATPRQLCEALLKAMDKWKEGE